MTATEMMGLTFNPVSRGHPVLFQRALLTSFLEEVDSNGAGKFPETVNNRKIRRRVPLSSAMNADMSALRIYISLHIQVSSVGSRWSVPVSNELHEETGGLTVRLTVGKGS